VVHKITNNTTARRSRHRRVAAGHKADQRGKVSSKAGVEAEASQAGAQDLNKTAARPAVVAATVAVQDLTPLAEEVEAEVITFRASRAPG